jgi:plasmid replication initiation protein
MSSIKNAQNNPKPKKNEGIKLIRKSNHLIEAQYKFDIWETRIFTTILARIRREDTDFQLYRIYLQDIITEFEINNHRAYDHLREAVKNLLNKKVYFNYETEYAERVTVYHLLRTGNYLVKVKDESKRNLEEYFDLTIDPLMKPFLLELKKQFTTYDMRNIMDFQSSYTVRIYEHLKQYESIGRRKMDIEYIRKTFDLGTKYPLFANFYQRIIAPAHRDINAHSDLMITEIERVKESGKITSLVFKFYRKDLKIEEKIQKQEEILEETAFEYVPVVAKVVENTPKENEKKLVAPLPAVKSPDPSEALYNEFEADVVKGFGVTPFVLLNLIQNYDAELIRKQIRITKRKRGASPSTNIAGFFVEAVKSDYNDPEEAKQAKKQAKINEQKQAELKQRQQEKRKELQLEYNEIFDIVSTQENNTIRKLVAADATLTARATEHAKYAIFQNLALAKEVLKKGYDLDAIDLDTWRRDVLLRTQIIKAIKTLEPKPFLYLQSFSARLEELKAEIEAI